MAEGHQCSLSLVRHNEIEMERCGWRTSPWGSGLGVMLWLLEAKRWVWVWVPKHQQPQARPKGDGDVQLDWLLQGKPLSIVAWWWGHGELCQHETGTQVGEVPSDGLHSGHLSPALLSPLS